MAVFLALKGQHKNIYSRQIVLPFQGKWIGVS